MVAAVFLKYVKNKLSVKDFILKKKKKKNEKKKKKKTALNFK